MKELISENIGIILYLIVCIITFILIDKKRFDIVSIVFIALSWVAIVFTLITLADKHYKSIEK